MADSTTPTFCVDTHSQRNATGVKLSKREKFQATKNYRKARNALTREAPPPPKPEVFTPVNVNCTSCNSSFLAKDKWTTICISCKNLTTFRDNIFSVDFTVQKMPESLPVYSEYMVSITYDIRTSNHSGYCSDHDDTDVTVTNRTETVLLPLFKEFKKSDITFDNTITNQDRLKKYYSPRRWFTCNCGDGRTTYVIVTAKVVKKSDMIQLDD